MKINNKWIHILFSIITILVIVVFTLVLKNFSNSKYNYYEVANDNQTPIGEIISETKIEQELPNMEYIKNIELQLATYQKKITSKIAISIVNQKGDILFNQNINGDKVQDNQYINLDVNLKNANSDKLKLVINGIDGSKENALTIWTSDKGDSNLKLTLDGTDINKELNFKINSKNLWGTANKGLALFMIIMISVVSLLLLKYINNNIEYNFILIYSGIMIFFVFLNPIGQTPDENVHFFRAYSISEGKIFGEKSNDGYSIGNYLPAELDNVYKITDSGGYNLENNVNISDYNIILNKNINNEKIFYTLNNTLVYPLTSYIPQALGVLIGRILNMSVYGIYVMGRLSNMILYGIISYFSIKIVKRKYKIILMFVSLLPMSIYLGTSLSADSIVIVLSLFYIALCFNNQESEKYKKLRYIIGILLSLSKFTYFPIVLLHWIYDRKNKRGIISGILFDMICIMIILFWNIFIMINVGNITVDPTVIPIEQLKFILINPIRYIFILMYTIYTHFNDYIIHINTFGWLTHTLRLLVPFTVLQIILYSLAKEKEEFEEIKANKDILIIVISILGTILLIFTALYLTWTPVGNTLIDGVQGRYFIPIIPIIMIFIKEYFNNTIFVIKNNHNKVLSLSSVLCLIYAVVYMVIYYWTPFR